MAWRIAIDVGGTFTDVVALNEQTGEEHVFKTSSTPGDPSTGFINGIEGIQSMIGDGQEISGLFHGSTVATNAILEADYARTGLIATQGYREMLEVARQTTPGDFGDITWWIKPPRVVPLELVREVPGRLDYRGNELNPLDEEAIVRTAAEFRELGVGAVAVSLLHSYSNPAHEQRVREVLQDEYPECVVSISSDVIREYREYERTLSTCLNTGLMPIFSSYVAKLEERAAGASVRAKLHMMKSSGGVASAAEMVQRPISAALSGPAAGVIAAVAAASSAGYGDVLTMDMGGTSTDIALIEDGVPRLLSEGKIDIYDLKVPMIDMTAVGAGGGSIAWIAGSGALRVGPKSAGSSPGPVCYGNGGTEATVTDANLVLGRISPYLLGGKIKLDREAAEEAIRSQVAEPLGLSLQEAAEGILEIAVNNMASGTRVVSVKRGRDPRDYALFAFGGAGGLHATRLADALGISTVLVPPAPGASSAEGLLHADIRVDHAITEVQREDQLAIDRLHSQLKEVRDRVLRDLAEEDFGEDEVRLEAFMDLRYVGQAYEIRVPYQYQGPRHVTRDSVLATIRSFHDAHGDRFGYSYEDKEMTEIVNVGITGFGLLPHPERPRPESAVGSWDDARKYSRDVFLRGRSATSCSVYDRTLAPEGTQLTGPAIIEQYDSTIVVDPNWALEVNRHGHLVLTRG